MDERLLTNDRVAHLGDQSTKRLTLNFDFL
jgi:hypothetical protein